MLERSVCGPATLGADRGYDTRDFVWQARALGVTPHVAQNDRRRRSAIDGRTTRHAGYRQSQRRRKRVEEVFGWIKTIGGGAKAALSRAGPQQALVRVNRRRLQPHPPGPARGGRRIGHRRQPRPSAQDQARRRTTITLPPGANRRANVSLRTQCLPQPTFFSSLLVTAGGGISFKVLSNGRTATVAVDYETVAETVTPDVDSWAANADGYMEGSVEVELTLLDDAVVESDEELLLYFVEL